MPQVVLKNTSANWIVAISSQIVTVDTISSHGLTTSDVITTGVNWTVNTFMAGLSCQKLVTASGHTFTFVLAATHADQTATETNVLAQIQNQLEPSSSLDFAGLLTEVAFFAGFPVTVGSRSADQTAILTSIVQNAYRKFYSPQRADPGDHPHDWTFRWTLRDLQINSLTGEVPLWDDFEGAMNQITYRAGDYSWVTLKIVPVSTIRFKYQQPSVQIFRPYMAAIEPIATDGTFAQRWQMIFWPLCTGPFTLRVRGKFSPPMISTSAPYPMGGAPYADLLRQFCLAEAETQLNDNPSGVQHQILQERLKAAIAEDMRNTEPDFYGYMGDRSDGQHIGSQTYHNLYAGMPGEISGGP